MANLSKIGSRKVLCGFVGNKRIEEECIFVSEFKTGFNQSLIPRRVSNAADYGTLEEAGWEGSVDFLINSFDKSTRSINFTAGVSYSKDGNHSVAGGDIPINLITGDYNTTSWGTVTYKLEWDLTYINCTFSGIATYTQAVWNSMYYERTELVKKLIYKRVPYKWMNTTYSSNYDYTSYSLETLNEERPACEVYANKVCRTGSVSSQWVSITMEEFDERYSVGGWEYLAVSSGDRPPSDSCLPDPVDHPFTVAVVYDMFDTYTHMFFRSSTTDTTKYYKCSLI